jgi:hypothetical protein
LHPLIIDNVLQLKFESKQSDKCWRDNIGEGNYPIMKHEENLPRKKEKR